MFLRRKPFLKCQRIFNNNSKSSPLERRRPFVNTNLYYRHLRMLCDMVWLSSSGEEKKIWKVKDATDDDNEKRTYIFWSKKLTGDFDSNELKWAKTFTWILPTWSWDSFLWNPISFQQTNLTFVYFLHLRWKRQIDMRYIV